MLKVKDAEASTKFYTDVLGLEISARDVTSLTGGEIHHDMALWGAPLVTAGQSGAPDFLLVRSPRQ